MSIEKIKNNFSDETRLALLEQSIGSINNTLLSIQSEIKEIRKDLKSDFRWILAIIGGLGFIMAHGFHWF